MREIKFRSWDKKTNKLRDVNSIAFHNKRELWHKDDSNTPKVINVWGYDIIFDKDIVLHREEEDIVLMQFTGLKDIEQFDEPKELYTGDIVSMHQFLFDGDEYENEVVGVLEYDNEVAAVCLTKMNNKQIQRYMGYGNDENGFKQEKIPVCMFYGLHECSWTYLGNIHENPELLEGEPHV